MCGRYAINDDVNALIDDFVRSTGKSAHDWLPTWQPQAEVRPTNQVPILLESFVDRKNPDAGVVRRAELAQWWLTPPFAKELRGKYPTFNARSETVTTLASFRGPVKHQRAVLPASSYFEWHTEGSSKTKYEIFAPEGSIYFAGLYSWWADPTKADDAADRWHLTTTMLTRDAVGDLAEIHPRTPVTLPIDFIDEWVNPVNEGTAEFVAEAVALATPIAESLKAQRSS